MAQFLVFSPKSRKLTLSSDDGEFNEAKLSKFSDDDSETDIESKQWSNLDTFLKYLNSFWKKVS